MSSKEVALFARKVKPNSSVQDAHTKALHHVTVKYPMMCWRKKLYRTIGKPKFTKKNLFFSQLPTPIVVSVVNNNAHNCEIQKSLFNFKLNNINFITLYRNGGQIPLKPLQHD